MSEEYPVVLDGETVGTLSVTRDGLLWVYDVRCTAPEGLVRLSVYGEKEGYLGVLLPDGRGGAGLRKCFTRTAHETMPQHIRYVSRAGEQPVQTKTEAETVSEPIPEKEPQNDALEAEPFYVPEEGTAPKKEPPDIQWRHCAGGALTGNLNGTRFLAVPLKSDVAPVDGQFTRQKIENMDYAVFEMKKGK